MDGSVPDPFQIPVWPGASWAGIRAARPRRPPSVGTGVAEACESLAASRVAEDPPVVRSWSDLPAAFPAPRTGPSIARSGMSKAIRRPVTNRTIEIT
jgi:hypothetical protein